MLSSGYTREFSKRDRLEKKFDSNFYISMGLESGRQDGLSDGEVIPPTGIKRVTASEMPEMATEEHPVGNFRKTGDEDMW